MSTLAPPAPSHGVAADRHCVFHVGPAWYSLTATAVQEIAEAPNVVQVPGSHRSLAGLCHVRSEFIPVFSLTELLEDQPQSASGDSTLLVLDASSGPWALLVDHVVGLEPLETLVNADGRSDGRSGAVLGTASLKDQVVRVLDASGLFQLANQTLQSAWTSPVAVNQE